MPTFRWTFTDAAGTREGQVDGVDLREAASRFFHSTPEGEQAAVTHGITPHILHAFPGNADPEAAVRTPAYVFQCKLCASKIPGNQLKANGLVTEELARVRGLLNADRERA